MSMVAQRMVDTGVVQGAGTGRESPLARAVPTVAPAPTVIFTTIGSLGDLHPFIAVALALKARGYRPVMAVPADHVAKCRAAGLEAVAVLPGLAQICAAMGMDQEDGVARLMANQRRLLEQAILPSLPDCAEALDALVREEGAAAIVGSVFVLAAPIVAEKHGIPMVPLVLQPMAMLSAYDPPATPDFWMMKHRPVGAVGVRWNRMVYGTIRRGLDLLYGKRINRVRAAHGLPQRHARRMLEPAADVPLSLCCYTADFGPVARDAPRHAAVVGFPMFDSACGAVTALCPQIEAFLDAGPPPLIFTLGSFAVYAAGDFYAEASAVARALGRRAIMLTGRADEPTTRDGDILTVAYAPHSQLFPRCAAIIHHGGAGTTGQALRAGKPQLIVPHMGDQFDNARRIEQMGIGYRLKSRHFRAKRAARMLARLMDDAAVAAEAARVAADMASANGAETAADAIAAALAGLPSG